MKIVAEAGCNHQGDFEIAKKMIEVAAECGADYIKFQKRDCEYWRRRNPEWDKPHPNGNNSFGETYYEHRKALEFKYKHHFELISLCKKKGIGYACSVWDIGSLIDIIRLEPNYIKIPSPCNLNFGMIRNILDNSKCDIHISLGMTTKKEKEQIYNYIDNYIDRVVLYHCTSGYPVPFEELFLREITTLGYPMEENYLPIMYNNEYTIGFSGHHLGIAADIAAMTLGARWIERHFTLDRTMKGTDHAASLEPNGLKKLVRDIRNVEQALKYKDCDLSPCEIENRRKLKWHL